MVQIIKTHLQKKYCENIIVFYEFLKTQRKFYFFYEFCNGPNLKELLIAHDAFVPDVNLELDIDGINPKPVITIKTISLDELLMQSDFISVHVPGGNVIGAAEIAKMKPGMCIVNTARGGVIDEMELLKALDAKHITRAALDVFEYEPTPKSELLHHPNISLTPHIGASTKEAQERIGDEIAQLIIAHLKK